MRPSESPDRGGSQPLVSVSLPVYNGARYVERAIDSILSQTYRNIELIITDNASTDDTPAIAARAAARDDRVRIVRNPRNLGAAPNFNLGVELARGTLFKWAAHDDICAPRFIEACVQALGEHPDAVLAYTDELDIDSHGEFIENRPYLLDTGPAAVEQRLARILQQTRGSPPIFGVIRTEVLRRTGLIGSYDQSDQVLLAEMMLHGRFHRVPEVLLHHREHPERSVRAYPTRAAAAVWFDSRLKGKRLYPETRLFMEYVKAVGRAPIGPDVRLKCTLVFLRWARNGSMHRKIGRELFGPGPRRQSA